MSTLDADVIVVGGGPAGSTTATVLADRGWDVLVLDKAAFPRDKPCAEYVSPGAVEVLDRLGALDALRARDVAWPSGMWIRTPRKSFLVSYGDSSAERKALGVRRTVLDQILLDGARQAGARVRERVFVKGAIVEGGRVVGVRAVCAEGEASLRARFVVAADGTHSAVTRSLGLDRTVNWPRRLGLIAHFAGCDRIAGFGEMHVGSGVYCGLAPVDQGLVSVGLVVAANAKPKGESAEAFFDRSVRALPGIAAALDGARRTTRVRGVGPLARRVRSTSGPGYLLVGDAAGFLDPFTGEGVFRALRGAEVAAAALDRALRSGGPCPTGYEAARRREFAAKERVCYLVQLFLCSQHLFEYVIGHAADRPKLGGLLAGVLGDYRRAEPALEPRFLLSLLRPSFGP